MSLFTPPEYVSCKQSTDRSRPHGAVWCRKQPPHLRQVELETVEEVGESLSITAEKRNNTL